jgi:hypothetical protein
MLKYGIIPTVSVGAVAPENLMRAILKSSFDDIEFDDVLDFMKRHKYKWSILDAR